MFVFCRHLCFVLQEFISICEALDLVPEEEMGNSALGVADTLAVQRAKKVGKGDPYCRLFLFFSCVCLTCFLIL